MISQDQELIHRFKNGDQSAYAELYKNYVKYAYGAALLIVKDSTIASDVCQDSFVRVYENISKFKDGLPFKPWFYRIIVNEAMRLTRRIMRWAKPVETVPERACNSLGPEALAINKELEHEIQKLMDKIPDKLKIPLILRYYSELTEDEIAHTLKIPLGTVKSRLNRGRQRLGNLFDEQQITIGGTYHA